MSTAGAQIDVGAEEIRFNIHGNKEKFAFRPRKEQCSMICIKYGPNPQGLREVYIQPQMVDRPVKKNKEIKMKSEQKKVKMTKEKTPKAVPTSPKKNKPVWKPKEEGPKSTKNKQDGVEAEERAAFGIYCSRIEHSINKQELNREGSYALDHKR